MNGEALYNLWRECAWEAHVRNNDLPSWAELEPAERETWNLLAEKVVPWEE